MRNYPKYTPKPKVLAKYGLFYQKEGAKYDLNRKSNIPFLSRSQSELNVFAFTVVKI